MLLFGQLLRRKEMYTLTGGSYLLLASLVAMLVFSREVFIPAILFLAVGDTVAALFGRRFGRTKFFRKTIAGTSACLVSCLIIAYIVSKLPNASLPLGIGIVGAVMATIVEALPVEVNDNVIIPISTGIVMQILKSIYA
jgi:glycerol-3-phosphate acyltransferase PlsY